MIVGIDLGATKTLVGLLTKKGKIIDQIIQPTPKKLKRGGFFIVEIIERLLKKNRIAKNKLIGIGIGAAGLVDQKKGDVILTNLPEWGKINLIKILRKIFPCPIFLENDAKLAALGEFWRGQGKGTKNMILLTIGTGIGGGIIIDKKLYTGQGYGGEIGHMIIDPDGPKCGCGSYGCFEALASGMAIKKRTNLEPKTIFVRARKGDSFANEIIREEIKALSLGIINIIHIFHPEKIILSGGLMDNGDFILPDLRKIVQNKILKRFCQSDRKVRIEKAKLANQAGLVGAVYLILGQSVSCRPKSRL